MFFTNTKRGKSAFPHSQILWEWVPCIPVESSHQKSDRYEGSWPKSVVPNLWHKILNFVSPCCYAVFAPWWCWGCHLVSSERLTSSVSYACSQCVLHNACRLLHLSFDWVETAKLSTSQWILLSHAETWESLLGIEELTDRMIWWSWYKLCPVGDFAL